MSEANVAAWAVVGAALGAYDGYKYAQKKGYTGWKKAAAIVGGAVLGAVNPFKVVKVAKTAAKVVTASKYTKAAVSAKKTTKVVKKVKAKPKQTVVAKKSTQEAFKKATAKKTAQTVKKQQKTAKAACFTAGTKIHTKDGYKNIEAIKVGDYVWSENPETHEKALKKVKKIFVREKDSIIRLAINGEAIETTDEHPFYIEGKGFTEAKWLKAGDEVRLATGNTAEVETIEKIKLETPVKVYNFEVEDYHTYYVSGQKVLVHNTCSVNNNSTPNIVYRAINEQDLATLSQGKGITAKNPNGEWTLREHLVKGSSKSSWINDPYISTTSDIDVAKGFNRAGKRLGIVKIDLNKVPSLKVKGYEIFSRVNGVDGLPYHYSVWQQEISVYRHIPQEAIMGFVK